MTNKAAWISAGKARPFKIDDAPMPEPEAHEVVIRNFAVAINPIDYGIQSFDFVVQSYPFVLGCDAAGEITNVGSAVTKFKEGDRVIALMDGFDTQKATNMSFQLYCATTETMVVHLPSNVGFAHGSVLPLAMFTATAGLFEKEHLALPYPQTSPESTGKVLLVWGGSSSVGSCAIQLAKAAGFEVATTASNRNHAYCMDLGADYVFDYSKDTIVEDIVGQLKGKDFAGVFDAISKPHTLPQSAQIASQLGGTKHIATVLPPVMPLPEGLPSDVKTSQIWATSAAHSDAGEAVLGQWMSEALASGTLKCKPEPKIVGQGLDKIQEACDRFQNGVSAQKLVVELP